jgi:hypothetical protein
MSNELVIIEEPSLAPLYPKFDLVKNKVLVYEGVEFDIDNFACLQVLTNHDPTMVEMVSIDGENVFIYYYDGYKRTVTLEERKVLWERYTLFLNEVRNRLLPNQKKEPGIKRLHNPNETIIEI